MIINKQNAEQLKDAPTSKDQKRVLELIINGYDNEKDIAQRLGKPESDIIDILNSIDKEFQEALIG